MRRTRQGGRIIKRGYVMIYRPDHKYCWTNGYVPEHRLIYEEYHKCCLLLWADVHHKNEDTQDNRIENLEVMTKSQHTILHNRVDMTDRKCSICGTHETRIRTDTPTRRPKWRYYNGKLVCSNCADRQRYILNKAKRIIGERVSTR